MSKQPQTPIKMLDEESNQNHELDLIRDWEMIPSSAFLFFPSGSEIKVGQKETQWRKIFENDQPYDQFEEQKLAKMQEKLNKLSIKAHSWFNKANKLRFLQAHKFKVQDTCKSIGQGSKWRASDFPIKMDHHLDNLLKSGCTYFCGRDKQYRPIIAVDIQKFKQKDVQFIPNLLMVMLQYMIDELLIQGQVQNYVLILDLSKFGMNMKNTVTKILSFTSNTYRGRLFACYLLGMPTILKFGWDNIASKFVSENTLKKIKISKVMTSPDMWTHIEKQHIEEKFGGTMTNIASDFWPPSKNLLNWEVQDDHENIKQPGHISKGEYEKLYMDGKLMNRKVNAMFIHHLRTKKGTQLQDQENAREKQENSLKQGKQPKDDQIKQIQSQGQKVGIHQNHHNGDPTLLVALNKKQMADSYLKFEQKSVQKQRQFIIQKRGFDLLFQTGQFLSIYKLN